MSIYDDAKAIWRFNSTWLDVKGVHDISNTGATFDTVIKWLGSASAKWDGINDFGAVANQSDFNQDEYFLYYPVYIAALGVRNTIISKHDSTADTGWLLTINPSNNIIFQSGNGGVWPTYNAQFSISGASIGWHLLGVGHSLTDHKIYWDDKLVKRVAGGSMAHNTKDVWFGRDANGGSYLAGQHDEAVWLTRVLTDGGVAEGNVAGGEWAEVYADYLAHKELSPQLNGFPFFFGARHY